MSGGFSGFSFTFGLSGSNTNQYTFSFNYTKRDPGEPEVFAFINNTQVGLKILEGSGPFDDQTIIVDGTSYPQFFYQGNPIDAYMNSSEGFNTTNIYGIFQRSNDTNNIFLGSNTKYVTIVTDSPNVKSVILPKIQQSPYNQFFFKYVNKTSSFIVCPYMSNVSYPITTSQFTTTNNNFEGVFDSKLGGSYSNSVAETSNANTCFSFISNSSNWYFTNVYGFNFVFTPAFLTSFPTSLVDSNSQILYYNYTNDSTLSTITLTNDSSSYIKYICIRNASASPVDFYIIGPQDTKIETQPVDPGTYPYITFQLAANAMRTVGMYYVANTSNYYILSDYDGTGLLDRTYPGSLVTLSNEVGIVNNENKYIKLAEPIQQLGFARFNTIVGIQTSNLDVRVAAPADNTSNSIVLSNTFTRAISLENNSNTTTNFSYTFATLYLNSSNTSITIPLYRYFV